MTTQVFFQRPSVRVRYGPDDRWVVMRSFWVMVGAYARHIRIGAILHRRPLGWATMEDAWMDESYSLMLTYRIKPV